MTHPSDLELRALVEGKLAITSVPEHVLGCGDCRGRLAELESGSDARHELVRIESLRATLVSDAPLACAAVARRLLGDPDLWAPDDDLHALECPWCGALLERRFAPSTAAVHGLAADLDRVLAALTMPAACVADPPFGALTARTLVKGEGDDATLDRFAHHLPSCRTCTAAVADVPGPPPEAGIADALVSWTSSRDEPAVNAAKGAYEAVEAALAESGLTDEPPATLALSGRGELARVLGDETSSAAELLTQDGRYRLVHLDPRRFQVLGQGVNDPWGQPVRLVARKPGEPEHVVEGLVTKAGVLSLRPHDPDLVALVEAGFRLELQLL